MPDPKEESKNQSTTAKVSVMSWRHIIDKEKNNDHNQSESLKKNNNNDTKNQNQSNEQKKGNQKIKSSTTQLHKPKINKSKKKKNTENKPREQEKENKISFNIYDLVKKGQISNTKKEKKGENTSKSKPIHDKIDAIKSQSEVKKTKIRDPQLPPKKKQLTIMKRLVLQQREKYKQEIEENKLVHSTTESNENPSDLSKDSPPSEIKRDTINSTSHETQNENSIEESKVEENSHSFEKLYIKAQPFVPSNSTYHSPEEQGIGINSYQDQWNTTSGPSFSNSYISNMYPFETPMIHSFPQYNISQPQFLNPNDSILENSSIGNGQSLNHDLNVNLGVHNNKKSHHGSKKIYKNIQKSFSTSYQENYVDPSIYTNAYFKGYYDAFNAIISSSSSSSSSSASAFSSPFVLSSCSSFPISPISVNSVVMTEGTYESNNNNNTNTLESNKNQINNKNISEKDKNDKVSSQDSSINKVTVPQQTRLYDILDYTPFMDSIYFFESNSEEAKTLKQLIQKLVTFQDNAYKRNPTKAHAFPRFYTGFKQCLFQSTKENVVAILLAKDLENSPGEGGVNMNVEKIVANAKINSVPILCCYKKSKLAGILHRGKSCSICCINDINGINTEFKSLLETIKSKYKQSLSSQN